MQKAKQISQTNTNKHFIIEASMSGRREKCVFFFNIWLLLFHIYFNLAQFLLITIGSFLAFQFSSTPGKLAQSGRNEQKYICKFFPCLECGGGKQICEITTLNLCIVLYCMQQKKLQTYGTV